MSRILSMLTMVFVMFGTTIVEAVTPEEAAVNRVIYTMVYMHHCDRVDMLLRRVCSDISAHLPEQNKHHCDLPVETFSQRTSADYDAFKVSNARTIEENQEELQAIIERADKTFENDMSEVLAGTISMFDLERLAGELGGHCLAVEEEWIVPKN